MPDSFVQLPVDASGKKLRTRQRTVGANTVEEQFVITEDPRLITYYGRAGTWRMPGRGGTIGQKIFAIHNATGSPVLVDVTKITVDCLVTGVKAIAVESPLVRVHRFTAVPTNGTACGKTPLDSGMTSSASVTCWQDASADRTLSATQLAVTIPANSLLAQEYGPRVFTAVGQEACDRVEFVEADESSVTLRALEGLTVFLDYATATFNPATDIWAATIEWIEYTLP